MIDIQRILCPVDFSDTSRHALAHAVAMATWYESSLTALHVIHPNFVLEPPILFAEFPKDAGAVEPDQGPLRAALLAWLEPARASGVKTEVLIVEGSNATAQILERAEALQMDLIVMGTHGRGGFERLVIGSVAEKVLRKARCPVLTVPQAVGVTATLPYRRLLCPIDFSESSLVALRFAASIAKESDARLTILHVFDWPADDELFVEQLDKNDFGRLVEERARARLDALLTDDLRTWCEPEIRMAYGRSYREILGTAEREKTDLIVMGVRGRNALDLTLFGSTTNHVVRAATCPVLTLKP
jgi:nucleotide-binding universal stress UspA family protein